MVVEGLQGGGETRPPRSLEEYVLALVGALELVAQRGGRPAFDCLFNWGFDRVYAWSYQITEGDAARAQALTSEVLLSAARALAQRTETSVTSPREPTR